MTTMENIAELLSVHVCVDPADDLVLDGVYIVQDVGHGRVRASPVYAPETSPALTHLSSRFRPVVGDYVGLARSFCQVCEGAREVRRVAFRSDGSKVDLGRSGPCPGCDGAGISPRARDFRALQTIERVMKS